jgi:putative transposase
VLRGFKSAVTTFARQQQIEFQWQARFYERIIRNQKELERIQNYIVTNPSRWESEHDNGGGLYR